MTDTDDPDNSRDTPEAYRERDDRMTKRIAAKLLKHDGQWVPVFVGNLSRYGIQVESDITVEIGEAISLSVEGLGDFDGVVRWSQDNHFGIHTIDTVNLGLLDDLA
ncbi:PilZ domain-containing protein [Parasphingorhabdus sp.]|uniref:PilZ domain-containing protein n=1 Tax=Parasphingorhabdus sp. TaxID=2709688 RepID=UPI0032631DA8